MGESSKEDGKIGYLSVAALGIGGMVGGGIFAVLGLAVKLAHGGTPVAFLLAGIIALITSYSYTKLSIAYPSQGGTVEFLNQAFGGGLFTGGINVLLWMSYIVMLSLYSFAFGSYGASLIPGSQILWKHVLITGSILLFTMLNITGAKLVGEAEEYIVIIKLLILLIFVGIGFGSIDTQRIGPGEWTSPLEFIAGGMIIFLAYEGFELIANAAGNVKNAKKTLPRAYYSSIGFVIVLYILIALVTVGNLSVHKIIDAKDYALAEAAKPFMGSFGFTLIAIAAMLSTGSAINATLYGAARVSFVIAKDGELPARLENKIWKKPIEGLLITAALTLLIANLFDLGGISTMGSAGFLLIFASVNAANIKMSKKTNSKKWIPYTGFILCLTALILLVVQTFRTSPHNIWVLIIMFGLAFLIEAIYREFRKEKKIQPVIKTKDSAPQTRV
jgi:amino acid transporter